MFDTKVTDGLIGSFEINENGDPPMQGAVVGFTIYKATTKLEAEKTPGLEARERRGSAQHVGAATVMRRKDEEGPSGLLVRFKASRAWLRMRPEAGDGRR